MCICIYIYIIPLGYSCKKQGGWAPETASFYTIFPCGWAPLGRAVNLYRSQGVKLELGGLRFILRHIKASLVHMVLGVLILYWFPFYARLEARLGVQSLYYTKMRPKIKPLFLFFHCEAWGSWFYTNVYISIYNFVYKPCTVPCTVPCTAGCDVVLFLVTMGGIHPRRIQASLTCLYKS